MNSAKKTARIAGALYLLSSAAAGVPLLYIPYTLIVPRDAAVTANNILASETSFRACIVSELIGATVFIFMVRALYRLLNVVNWSDASLMVTLALRLITFPNALNEVAAPALTHGATFLSVFDKPQRDALAIHALVSPKEKSLNYLAGTASRGRTSRSTFSAISASATSRS